MFPHLVRQITHLLIASFILVCHTKQRCPKMANWEFPRNIRVVLKMQVVQVVVQSSLALGPTKCLILHMATEDVLWESCFF